MNADEVRTVAQAVIEAFELQRKMAAKRHYGFKAIAKAVKDMTGHEPHRDTISAWIKREGFPVDRDCIGPFVTQWLLERWLDTTRKPMTGRN
jgi:hypothetical protein